MKKAGLQSLQTLEIYFLELGTPNHIDVPAIPRIQYIKKEESIKAAEPEPVKTVESNTNTASEASGNSAIGETASSEAQVLDDQVVTEGGAVESEPESGL